MTNIRYIPYEGELPPLVIDSWLKAYRKSKWAGVIPNNLYTPVMSNAIQQLIKRGARIMLAVNADYDPPPGVAKHYEHHILGWLCYEYTSDAQPVTHFAFVKPGYRRNGIACALMRAAGFEPYSRFYYTFRTDMSSKFKAARYCPEIARRAVA